MKLVINSYDSYKFSQVWEIISWKDGCVWEVKPIGYISEKDKSNYPSDKYELSSISTSLTGGRFCTLDPLLEE